MVRSKKDLRLSAVVMKSYCLVGYNAVALLSFWYLPEDGGEMFLGNVG
jgi:hypothetical protein